jgi:hypothetical protein
VDEIEGEGDRDGLPDAVAQDENDLLGEEVVVEVAEEFTEAEIRLLVEGRRILGVDATLAVKVAATVVGIEDTESDAETRGLLDSEPKLEFENVRLGVPVREPEKLVLVVRVPLPVLVRDRLIRPETDT